MNLDGKLQESIWDNISYASGFTQGEPDEGASATSKTKVGFVYTQEALYIGARMCAEEPGKIQAPMTRRDQLGNAERITISLDTYLDRRTSHSFAVSASGVRADYYTPEDNYGFRSRDYTFDPVWSVETKLTLWAGQLKCEFLFRSFDSRTKRSRYGV